MSGGPRQGRVGAGVGDGHPHGDAKDVNNKKLTVLLSTEREKWVRLTANDNLAKNSCVFEGPTRNQIISRHLRPDCRCGLRLISFGDTNFQ